jgi:hypothetical protein
MIDEQQDGRPFHMIVSVGNESGRFEPQSLSVFDIEVDQLICHGRSMYLTNAVNSRRFSSSRDAGARIAVLFARKSNMCAMNCISPYDVKDLGIFLTG